MTSGVGFFPQVKGGVPANNLDSFVFSISVLPDSEYIVAGSWSSIKIWSVSTGACHRVLASVQGSIFSLDVTPDGNYLVSGDIRGYIGDWDVREGEKLLAPPAGVQ